MADSLGTDDSDGWLGGLVADEDNFDRGALWRLGLWGVTAIGAVTLGVLCWQLPVNAQRSQVAASEPSGFAKQLEASIHDNQIEARRLSAAIATLNSDRDRLFSRLSAIEQGLDVVTGSIRKVEERPAAATPWPDVPTARIIDTAPFVMAAPPSTTPQTTATAPSAAIGRERVATAPPAPARTPQPAETQAAAAAPDPADAAPPVILAMPIPEPQPAAGQQKAAEETPVAVAAFGVDLGPANSIGGLRALWRGLVKAHRPQLEGLRPVIAVQERRNGLGLQLRLIAGPIKDAAAAAAICVVLDDARRDCKTTTFDGQRLSLVTEPEQRAAPARSPKPRRAARIRQPKADVQAETERKSTLSTMLGVR